MNTHKMTAISVGVLYIVATVAAVLSVIALGSIVEEPDNLIYVSEHENQVIIGAFFELIMAVSVAGIAFMIYPVIKQINEGLVRWY